MQESFEDIFSKRKCSLYAVKYGTLFSFFNLKSNKKNRIILIIKKKHKNIISVIREKQFCD